MKIAIDIRNIGRQKTGSEVVVREIVRHLLEIDRENVYMLLTDTDDAEVLAYVRRVLALDAAPNAEVVVLRAPNKFVWAAWSVWRWARREKPDVYHTEYILPFFMPRSVKLVTHVHDVSFAALPQYIGAQDRFFLRTLIPWSLRRADKIIAVSQFTKDEIVRHYNVPAKKIALAYNALSPQFAQQATQEQIDAARTKYQLPEKYIFSLGTMQPRKNIPFLVAAFARVAHKMPDMTLVLSGKQGHHFDSAIEATIAQYPDIMTRVMFTGFVDDADLPAVYAGAYAFVFPSLYEGFGLPLVEAMSQGVPLVANDIPVFREVAANGAIYADAHDLDAFADALYTMVMCSAAQRTDLIRVGKERIRLFSWQETAAQMRDIFTHLF